jgi:hypothetical protein
VLLAVLERVRGWVRSGLAVALQVRGAGGAARGVGGGPCVWWMGG